MKLFRRNWIHNPQKQHRIHSVQVFVAVSKLCGSVCLGLAGSLLFQPFRGVSKCFLAFFSYDFDFSDYFLLYRKAFKSHLFMGNKSPLLTVSLLLLPRGWWFPPPPQLLICHVSSFFSVSLYNQKKMFCVPEGSPVSIERLPFDLACVMMHHTNNGL